ncbi:MAG: neuraminidase-like domain-containing protein, partial [Kangiellaceae bacterium]|nr:neuraminidase-like domain-containing protein [Kangiellaceae bacterium]
AEHQYAHVLAKLTQFRFDFFKDSPAAVPEFFYSKNEVDEIKKDIPNIESLFGSLDFCDCEHCSSIYSPAAYLTDLLRFLEEKDAVAPSTSVKEVLISRRPDIANIKLNCGNTHTALPYIDLVNEVLENAIPPAESDFHYQSELTSKELRAVPQYLRKHAYHFLRDKPYPMSHGFNLWERGSRLFLEHLGCPRYKIIDQFRDLSDTSSTATINADMAAEYFGISSEQKAWIIPEINSATTTIQTEFWHFDASLTTVSVAEFLSRTQLKYAELLELLQVEWANLGSPKVEIERPLDDCDTRAQNVINLTEQTLDRFHRFVRLWRHTDWAMWELDLMLRSPLIGAGDLDATALHHLRVAHQLQSELKIPVDVLVAFGGALNSELVIDSKTFDPIPHLYERLFQNVAVTNPVDTDFNLPLVAIQLSSKLNTLIAAFQLSEADLKTLIELTDDQLTDANLAFIFRHVALSRSLRVSISSLLKVLQMTGVDLTAVTLSHLQSFVDSHQLIKDSPLSIEELDYCLNPAPESPIGLREEVVQQYVEVLRAQLSTLNQNFMVGSPIPLSLDQYRDIGEKYLTFLNEDTPDEVQQALDLVEGKWSGSDSERLAFINTFFGFIPVSENPSVVLTQESYWDDDVLSGAEETLIADRYQFVLRFLFIDASRSTIFDHIVNITNLSADVVKLLLNHFSPISSTSNYLALFQDPRLLEQDAAGEWLHPINNTNYAELYFAYSHVHKVSILLAALELPIDALTWLLSHASEIDVLDLGSLPVTSAPAGNLFMPWYRWQRLLDLYARYPEPETTSLWAVLGQGLSPDTESLTSLLTNLATLTQWDEEELAAVVTQIGLSHTATDKDFTKVDTYMRLSECMALLKTAGVATDTMSTWADRLDMASAEEHAVSARKAAKSKYGEDEWLDKVKPLQDTLREAQREALVEFFVEDSQRNQPEEIGGEPNALYFREAFDLYNHYLIDVEMSACQLTSRIKQAISSVQLFIQRCFLNLEPEVVVGEGAGTGLNEWSHWKWMKHYRIWEASRKVFLYPENWIEPDLRDDKTPFFKEFEDELQQNSLTTENVERAYQNYLHKVDGVSNLETMSLYHDKSATNNKLHVLARTKNRPHSFFYRQYNLAVANWTPWEKVDIDIEGEHPTLYVYNRKVYLFWLMFSESPEKLKKNPSAQQLNSGSGKTSDNPEPSKTIEIQLAWSEQNFDGWTPKKISARKLLHPWQRPKYSYHIKPRYKPADNSLWVDLFVSTSQEFNDSLFFHQYSQDKFYRSRVRYKQTIRPWHSSTFVFNGHSVKDIKLRGIWATYHNPASGSKEFISSHQYVTENFDDEGRALTLLSNA